MYEVNWSIIGTEPDSLPFYFDTWEAAFHFLQLEISHLKYMVEEDDEFTYEVGSVIVQLYDRINITVGKDLTFTVGNISYWLLDLGKAFGDSMSPEERYRL